MTSYDTVKSLLRDAELLSAASSVTREGEAAGWAGLWNDVASNLSFALASGDLMEFERAFPIVRAAIDACDPSGRQAATAALFGYFTRHAIHAGIDRTRFVEWLGPAEIFKAPFGRLRGRVLYFKTEKGYGWALGSDGVVHFVHYSQIHGRGFRSANGGELIEFKPIYGRSNAGPGMMAFDVQRVPESGAETSAVR